MSATTTIDPELMAWATRVASYKTVDYTVGELLDAWYAEGFTAEVPSYNWRPGLTPVARKSVRHTISNAAQIIGAVARRSDVDLPDLGALECLQGEVEAALLSTVVFLRRRGASWADIGGELGVSRQAAQQRFGAAR